MTVSVEERWFAVSMERSYLHALINGVQLDGVGPAQFSDPDHREIAGVIAELRRNGRPSDEAMILGVLRQRGAAARGKDWGFILSDIISAPAVPSSAPEYANYICSVAALEKIRTVASEVTEEIDRPGGRSDPAATLAGVLQKLDQAREHGRSARPLQPTSSKNIIAAAGGAVEWAVRPLHTVKGVRITGAPGKHGKTTWTIAEMVSAIHGGTLAGQFEVGRGHTVAWFDAENTTRSWSRKFLAVCRGLEIDAQDIIDRGRFLYFNSRGLYLDDPGTLHAVTEAARKAGATQIVLDSLTRIHRQKEADAVAMSSFFIDRIFKLRDEAVAGITILHHTRKPLQGYRDNADDALRGTGDLRNVVDSYISLNRSRKDKSVFTLTVSAQRDAAEEGPFHWRQEWTDDQGVRFLPADPAEAEAGEPLPAHRPPKVTETARRVIREALVKSPEMKAADAIRVCEEAGVGKTTAKNVWREINGD